MAAPSRGVGGTSGVLAPRRGALPKDAPTGVSSQAPQSPATVCQPFGAASGGSITMRSATRDWSLASARQARNIRLQLVNRARLCGDDPVDQIADRNEAHDLVPIEHRSEEHTSE